MNGKERKTPIEILCKPYEYADEDIVSCFKRLGILYQGSNKEQEQVTSKKSLVEYTMNTTA